MLRADWSAPWVGDTNYVKGNAGRLGNKPFPMGSTCDINGVEIPTFCCASENGGITADLLVAMGIDV